MLRYRCPQCDKLLQAHELRAGKTSVCGACLSTHLIPLDRSAWLTAGGEPLFPRLPTPIEAVAQTGHSPVDRTLTPELEATAAVNKTESFASPNLFTNDADPERPEAAGLVERAPNILESQTSAPVIEPVLTQVKSLNRPATQPISRIAGIEPNIQTIEEAVEASELVHVQTQVEIAAALTEVLTHRMKPRRRPRRDLRLSTAGWLVLTGLGIALMVATLFTSANYRNTILAIGGVQVLIGYGWIIFLTSHRNRSRGLACAAPPLTFYYLCQWKYARLRPLRFCVTGVVLLGMGFLASKASTTTRSWVGAGLKREHMPVVDTAELSKLERIREYKKRNAYDKLIDLLQELKQTDSLKSVDAKDSQELAKELRELCSHPDTGVKVAALAAYTQWGGEDARDFCLKAIQSPSRAERLMAIQLLPRWKGSNASPEVARALAALIGRQGEESDRAEEALVEIGGVPAERAALAVLLRSDDRNIRLIALSILAQVGGPESVSALKSYAEKSLDEAIKTATLETISTIQARMSKP